MTEFRKHEPGIVCWLGICEDSDDVACGNVACYATGVSLEGSPDFLRLILVKFG
jgi:hypothetical protein